jgi:hypothetical protein
MVLVPKAWQVVVTILSASVHPHTWAAIVKSGVTLRATDWQSVRIKE